MSNVYYDIEGPARQGSTSFYDFSSADGGGATASGTTETADDKPDDKEISTGDGMTTSPSGGSDSGGGTATTAAVQDDDGQQPGATATQDDGENGTPTPPSLAGNSGSSSSTSTTTTPSTTSSLKSEPSTNDETFHGTTIGDVEDFLRGRIEHYKSLEESEEDRQKREKRERRYKNLAAIGDILGSFHKAYSHARGVEAMDLPSISEKAQERIDKARLEREKNADRLMNYVNTLDKLNSSKAQSDYQQKTLAIRQQQQAAEKAAAEKAAAEKAAAEKSRWEAEFGLKKELNAAKVKEAEARAARAGVVGRSSGGRKGSGRKGSGRKGSGGKSDDGMETVTVQGYNSVGQKETVRYKRPHEQDNSSKKTGKQLRHNGFGW